jgi:hypothetical protein
VSPARKRESGSSSEEGESEGSKTFPICYETLFLLFSFHNTIAIDPVADLFRWRENFFVARTKRAMNKFTRSSCGQSVMDVKMMANALKGHKGWTEKRFSGN